MAIRLALALVMTWVISWELDLGAADMNLLGFRRDAQAISWVLRQVRRPRPDPLRKDSLAAVFLCTIKN